MPSARSVFALHQMPPGHRDALWLWLRTWRSDFRGEFVEQVVVCLGINFPREDLACAGQCDRRNLRAQLLLGAEHFLVDFGPGAGNDAITFSPGLALGFF